MILDFLKKYSFIISGMLMISIAISIFLNGYKPVYTIAFLIVAAFSALINVVGHIGI